MRTVIHAGYPHPTGQSVTIPSGERVARSFPDPVTLRLLLDDLESGLRHAGNGAVFASPLGFGYPAILSSLQDILLAVEQDLSPRGPRIDGIAALFAGGRLASVRTCLNSLQTLLLTRVRTTLAPEKIAVLRTLLGLPVPDFLDMFGRSTHENTNSSLIAWLLDPRTAPTIGPATLTVLAGLLDDGERWRSRIEHAVKRDAISVQRECPVVREGATQPHPDRIDLVVWGPDFVLAIENKVRARERADQTSDYWDWLAGHRWKAHAGIFLSPGGLPAGSHSFKSVSYLDLLACLLEGPTHTSPEPAEQVVLASYVKTLAAGLLRSEFRMINQERNPSNEWTQRRSVTDWTTSRRSREGTGYFHV